MAKNCLRRASCCGNLNWSPPNAATHGFIPPVPVAINVRPTIVNVLKKNSGNSSRIIYTNAFRSERFSAIVYSKLTTKQRRTDQTGGAGLAKRPVGLEKM